VPPDEDTDIEWLERDARAWVLFVNQPDQLTARMTCTYLETGGVEARVSTHAGRYCVEVPVHQLETACTIYMPGDSAITPPMQEESRKTGIHTGRHLREQLAKQAETASPARPGGRVTKWLLRLVVLAILGTLILLIFGD
jgi:hypothetical protein